MRAGAHDYIMKDNLARLVPAIERELSEAQRRCQQRRLEEQLFHAQKMECVGRLAGGVAHEFNNFLTPVIGYAHLLMNMLPPEDSMRSALGEIEKAATRATDMAHQLLEFSHRRPIEPNPTDLNVLVSDLSKMLRRIVPTNIELIILSNMSFSTVKVDPSQIEQLLMNLTVNACDAMPEGGKLIIETSNLTVDNDNARGFPDLAFGEYAVCKVSDTGIGMRDEIRCQVFEPFFTTKEPGKGTGLGLATCYAIVSQSNGLIRVDSDPGIGTVFEVYLPTIHELADVVTPEQAVDVQTGGDETVLLVEDEPAVRALIGTILRDQGYTVLEASNGEEALRVNAKHANQEIHVLLSDMVMPQMGGLELAEEFADCRPNTRILMMSGYNDEFFRNGYTLNNHAEFLAKPFTPAALTTKIRDLMAE